MRKIVVLVLAVGTLLGALALPAAAAPSNGCKGVENAQGKANAKAQGALAAVAEKLGCTEPAPDALACPDGSVALSTWNFDGYYDPTPDQYGYGTWVGSWVLVSGSGATIDSGDAGGFYWSSTQTVEKIVIRSSTGEVVTIDPIDPVSQNWLTDRTGMEDVRFCG